jgi:hypothetical protein
MNSEQMLVTDAFGVVLIDHPGDFASIAVSCLLTGAKLLAEILDIQNGKIAIRVHRLTETGGWFFGGHTEISAFPSNPVRVTFTET